MIVDFVRDAGASRPSIDPNSPNQGFGQFIIDWSVDAFADFFNINLENGILALQILSRIVLRERHINCHMLSRFLADQLIFEAWNKAVPNPASAESLLPYRLQTLRHRSFRRNRSLTISSLPPSERRLISSERTISDRRYWTSIFDFLIADIAR